jgi:tRNA A-37 threonylcarbamoyl transferase component Bud32
MHTPPNPDAPRPDGSTGEYPHAPPTPPGSSLVNLFGSSLVRLSADAFRPANTDDAPTVITPVVPAADAARPAVAGQKLGHFELIEAIGAGGMATVLKARDLELGRTVALKILPPDTARDPEAVTRFKQEARAAAKLDHDNVARVYFCGEDRGLHFIAFEFVEGENLRQRIDRLGRLTPAEAVRFMLQVAAGLGHAADRGVVHRDIKPSNILITSDGRAKIVDMGLARHLESHSVNGGVTQSGVTLGTFDYISPEQAMDPRRADVRSDIYSLGCAFYHALTGRPPVPEGTAAKKLHAHQHEAPTDPRDLNPAVPDGLAMVLARMMAKDPANRYPTPAELIADLSALGRELGLASEGTAETLALGSAARVPAVVGEPPRLPLGLLLGAAAVAVAAAVLFGRPTADPGPPRLPDPAAHTRAVAPDIAAGPPTSKPDAPAKGPVTPDNEAAFADAVNGAKETLAVALRPGHRYDLTRLKAGVLFAGKELTVEPQPAVPGGPTGPPVLVVAAAPPGDEVPAGGFAARGAKRVTLRGIDVRVAAPDGAPEMADPVGLLLAGAEQVVIDSCRVRATGKAAMFKIVGVAVEPPADPGRPADVTVRHTLFDLGPKGVGLRLPERAQASAADCGFGPHAAGIQLRAEEPATAEGAVRLVSCTFVVDRSGAAVAADAGASAVVSAAGCVFAAPVPPRPTTGPPGRCSCGCRTTRPAGCGTRRRTARRTPTSASTRSPPAAGTCRSTRRPGWTPPRRRPPTRGPSSSPARPGSTRTPAPTSARTRPTRSRRSSSTSPASGGCTPTARGGSASSGRSSWPARGSGFTRPRGRRRSRSRRSPPGSGSGWSTRTPRRTTRRPGCTGRSRRPPPTSSRTRRWCWRRTGRCRCRPGGGRRRPARGCGWSATRTTARCSSRTRPRRSATRRCSRPTTASSRSSGSG